MNTLGAVLSVFLLMGVGYGVKKSRLLQMEDASILSKIIINITLPCFVFEAIYNYHQAIPLSVAKIPLIGFLIEALVMVMAYFVGKRLKLDKPTIGGLILAAAFGNTAFIGYPVVQAAFGKNALMPAALYDQIGMMLPLCTIGMVVAAGFAGERVGSKQLLKMAASPTILAIPIALMLRSIALPEPILKSIGYLANASVAMAMISIGLSMSARSLKGLGLPITLACGMKLGILPLLTFYAARAIGISGTPHAVTVIESGMPTAVMSCIIATKFGANERFVAGIVFISTLISLITLSAMLLMMG